MLHLHQLDKSVNKSVYTDVCLHYGLGKYSQQQFLSQEELEEIDYESTDMYKSSLIEWFTKRPQSVTSVDDL